MRPTIVLSLCVLGHLASTACTPARTGNAGPPAGSEGGPCYGNGTCDSGLVCDAAERCVADVDPCAGIDCSGHGTCGGGACACDLGYTGLACAECAAGYVPSGGGCVLDGDDLNPWDEQSGAIITQLPYKDLFRSDPVTGQRVELGSAPGQTLEWRIGEGWNGENALYMTMPTSGEDNNGIAAQRLPGAQRRINMRYLLMRTANLRAKWFLLTRYDGDTPRGDGVSRFNVQTMFYSGISDFPATTGFLPTPNRGVAWPQMPFNDPNPEEFGAAATNVWMSLEVESNLDTGLYAVFGTFEGGVTRLLAGYNIYRPTRATESGVPEPEPTATLSDGSYWGSTGGPGGFPYAETEPGAAIWISHYVVSNAYIGPPAGFASDGRRPQVAGEPYRVGYFGEPSTIVLESADQP